MSESRATTPPAIAAQLYSVRDAVAADLPAALDRLAAIGFTNVELYGFIDDADEYARLLKANGLTAPSGHAPVLALDEPQRAFETAATVGVTTLIDPHHAESNWQTLDDVRRNADRMNELGVLAKTFGLTFGYHNHEFEVQSRIGDRSALEVLASALSPDVVLEVDTFWVQVGGEDAPALLERLGARVQLIHVKDGPLSLDNSTQLPAGQGEMDVPAVLAAAPQAMRVIEFDDYAHDPFDGLAASLAWLQEHDA